MVYTGIHEEPETKYGLRPLENALSSMLVKVSLQFAEKTWVKVKVLWYYRARWRIIAEAYVISRKVFA